MKNLIILGIVVIILAIAYQCYKVGGACCYKCGAKGSGAPGSLPATGGSVPALPPLPGGYPATPPFTIQPFPVLPPPPIGGGSLTVL